MATTYESAPDDLHDGRLNAAVSNAVVSLLAKSTGRGPTKARTTIDRDLVAVVLQNTLTDGERYLVGKDQGGQVQDMRAAYQEAMSQDCIAAVEDLIGRKVLAFMSTNHIDPDLAVEIFILEPEGR